MDISLRAGELEIDKCNDHFAEFLLRTFPGSPTKIGELAVWGTQSERLQLISEWIEVELGTADLSDRAVIEPLSDIIRKLGTALSVEVAERDPGPVDPQDTMPTANGLMDLVFGKKAS